MRPRDEKLWEICLEIYRALYKAAIPSVDFDAVWKSYGKLQFYDKFYLEMGSQDAIIDHIIRRYPRLAEYEKDIIMNTVMLGAAPSSVKQFENRELIDRLKPFASGCFSGNLNEWPQLKPLLRDVYQHLVETESSVKVT